MSAQRELIGIAVAAALLTSGCFGGGEGSSSLFGDSGIGGFFSSLFGGSDSGSDGVINLASLTGGDSGGAGDLLGGGGDLGGSFAAGAAAVHSPEPASMALFGMGLAGLGLARRKRKIKVS